jgi:hypothetical protein
VHTGRWNSGIQDQSARMRAAGFAQIETGDIDVLGNKAPTVGLVLGSK